MLSPVSLYFERQETKICKYQDQITKSCNGLKCFQLKDDGYFDRDVDGVDNDYDYVYGVDDEDEDNVVVYMIIFIIIIVMIKMMQL